jgi:hypothetical protein
LNKVRTPGRGHRIDQIVAEAGDDDDLPDPGLAKRVELPFEQALARKLDQAFGPVGGKRKQARPFAGAEDDGFSDRHAAPASLLNKALRPGISYWRAAGPSPCSVIARIAASPCRSIGAN